VVLDRLDLRVGRIQGGVPGRLGYPVVLSYTPLRLYEG
jgi:hypothetical protein